MNDARISGDSAARAGNATRRMKECASLFRRPKTDDVLRASGARDRSFAPARLVQTPKFLQQLREGISVSLDFVAGTTRPG